MRLIHIQGIFAVSTLQPVIIVSVAEIGLSLLFKHIGSGMTIASIGHYRRKSMGTTNHRTGHQQEMLEN
jgi:hypothetical protein